ncbi:MAG: phosphoglucomutase, alpha-D-glucose phosphate-specific, partial [Micrococcales bacterium]|nr:phosphoglucomutase, alpha-D-glucose phosphate-specific [Micrococcales bacterium]
MHQRAGTPALPEDLVDLTALEQAYYNITPDPANPNQKVVFGTSGHRGSSLDGAFNEAHIIAITAAIVEYRRSMGYNGPLFVGRDTHALSLPAWRTALEVLAAAEVQVRIDARDSFTPTPAISHAILVANGATSQTGPRTSGPGLADGIVITPSHNPPRDGGFKYNPPNGGPADTDATGAIAARANQILASGQVGQVARLPLDKALNSDFVQVYDFLKTYVEDLANVIDLD